MLVAVGVPVVALVSLVGTIVYSHATLRSDVRHMHQCLKLTLRSTAKTNHILRKHIQKEDLRFTRIEKKLGIDYD